MHLFTWYLLIRTYLIYHLHLFYSGENLSMKANLSSSLFLIDSCGISFILFVHFLLREEGNKLSLLIVFVESRNLWWPGHFLQFIRWLFTTSLVYPLIISLTFKICVMLLVVVNVTPRGRICTIIALIAPNQSISRSFS